jgi:hypothetical protein
MMLAPLFIFALCISTSGLFALASNDQLLELKSGNQRFVKGQLTHPDQARFTRAARVDLR